VDKDADSPRCGVGATDSSAKLAYAAQKGTALTQTNKVDHVGFILIDTHHAGVEYGQSFDRHDALPLTAKGAGHFVVREGRGAGRPIRRLAAMR
jgi:hypothetical protein